MEKFDADHSYGLKGIIPDLPQLTEENSLLVASLTKI